MKILCKLLGGLCMLGAAVQSYSGEMAGATFYVGMAIYFRLLAQDAKP